MSVKMVRKNGGRTVTAAPTIQYIHDAGGKPAYAVLPIAEYESLRERTEMIEDVAVYDAAKAEIAAGAPVLPAALVDRLLDGDSPIRVWREHRRLTQTALAGAAGVDPSYVSQIERGHRDATVKVLRRLAEALNCGLDNLAA